MNKLGVVLGVAAVVTLTGCLDPNYKRPAQGAQNEVKPAPAVEVEKPVEVTPDVKPVPGGEIIIDTVEQKCTCAPGTKHAVPCGCGAADCKCVVEKPVEVKPVAPATTTYIVQRGDYLAKISKKYNIKIDALRAANPQIKNDIVKIGQKINLPGNVDVGEQTVPAGSFAVTPKKEYTPYSGATKEYVVKAGDTLGGIAYGNGSNIRQIKELNKLTSNNIRVGQKLLIPAAGAAAATTASVAKTSAAPVVKAEAPKTPAKTQPAKVPAPATTPAKVDKPAETPVEAPAVVAEPVPAADSTVAPAAPAADESVTHVVQEGEDITGLAIRFSLVPSEIRELNNLSENDELKPGQILKLPANTQL